MRRREYEEERVTIGVVIILAKGAFSGCMGIKST